MVDEQMVEELVQGAISGMAEAVVPKLTSHEEVLSAAFTFLDRTLRSIRKLQHPHERFVTAERIGELLEGMITDHGKVPS